MVCLYVRSEIGLPKVEEVLQTTPYHIFDADRAYPDLRTSEKYETLSCIWAVLFSARRNREIRCRAVSCRLHGQEGEIP